MRPQFVEMEGFGAFRDPTTVDFAGADLFALQGPTGAGKSTVIDAICFALYGNVPRYDDQRLVGAAMSAHAVETRVRLRFEVGGTAYDVIRVVRRTAGGKVSTREARLEAVDGDVIAGREGELKAAVEGLLGLTFDDFTRCVVLPQGAFARFLHDKPADRQALLVRLLDLGVYGRMLQRANLRAAELDRQSAFIEGQLAALPDSSSERIAELERAVETLRVAAGEVTHRLPAHTAAVEASRAVAAELAADRSALGALGAVEMPDDVGRLAELAAAASSALRVSEADHREAVECLDAEMSATSSIRSVSEIEHHIARWDRHDKGVAVVADLDARVAEAAARVDETAATAERATVDARNARRRVDEVRTEHLAHALAAELRAGDECPVCLRVVESPAVRSTPPVLARVEREADDADRAAARATRDAASAREEAAQLSGSLRRAVDLLAELAGELLGGADRDGLGDELAASRAAEATLADARRSELERRRLLAERRADVESLETREARFAARLHVQRDAVVALGPPPPGPSLSSTWAELARWALEQIAVIEARSNDAMAEQRRHDEAAEMHRRGIQAIAADAGVQVAAGASPDTVTRLIDAESSRAVDRRAAAMEALEQRSALLERREQIGADRAVATELGRLLKADRFQRWLVESTLMELADRASQRLAAMTGDRFSLDLQQNGEFAVIDHHEGDERRPVRTLSGGETFQASLALALALSDHLVELSGRRGHALESIFLDEGFGTLDIESLDAVASAIESLHHDGRMVGIVTHVPALAERMPVRFVVSRGARSASVERVTA